MRKTAVRAAGVLAAVTMIATACGGGDDGTSAGESVRVGLLMSQSGPASAAFKGVDQAMQARFKAYRDSGGACSSTEFNLVTADDQSGPQGALAGAQKLIQQDKVYAMVGISSYFFGAAQFVTTTGASTPVIGGAFDAAPQWLQSGNNLFAAAPKVPDYDKTYSTIGEYWKKLGVTKVAAVSYDTESSRKGAEQILRSADKAGLSRGLFYDKLALGSSDVGSIVLGIKNSGAQAVFLPVNPETSMAIIAGLRQSGVTLKSVMSASGYGGDLLASAPAVKGAQGMTFMPQFTPVELNTPATQKYSEALKKYAGSATGIPTFGQTYGWWAADLLIYGLEKAGCDASQADFMTTLRADENWDAGGLFPLKRSFTDISPDRECYFLIDLEGEAFVPRKDASPVCGDVIG
ncbi:MULTISPECIES: ABC transporter substrate-binding protein [Gordonia]|nr:MULTISPECIES: ABC transporter substrate-binding protein [Gordonia]